MEIPESESAAGAEKKTLPAAQIFFLLVLLITYPLVSIGFDIMGATSPGEISSRTRQIYLPALTVQVAIIACLWILMTRTGAGLPDIGLRPSDINGSNVLAGLLFFAGAWLIMVIAKNILTGTGHLPENNLFHLLPVTLSEKAIWVFLAAGAAFSEEIAFRGYVISRLKIATGSFWIGAILGSGAFSMGHLYQGPAGVLLIFLYGLLFSGMYIARKSVVPCIIAHFLQDLTILLLP